MEAVINDKATRRTIITESLAAGFAGWFTNLDWVSAYRALKSLDHNGILD